jgi:hypothetical protein
MISASKSQRNNNDFSIEADILEGREMERIDLAIATPKLHNFCELLAFCGDPRSPCPQVRRERLTNLFARPRPLPDASNSIWPWIMSIPVDGLRINARNYPVGDGRQYCKMTDM